MARRRDSPLGPSTLGHHLIPARQGTREVLIPRGTLALVGLGRTPAVAGLEQDDFAFFAGAVAVWTGAAPYAFPLLPVGVDAEALHGVVVAANWLPRICLLLRAVSFTSPSSPDWIVSHSTHLVARVLRPPDVGVARPALFHAKVLAVWRTVAIETPVDVESVVVGFKGEGEARYRTPECGSSEKKELEPAHLFCNESYSIIRSEVVLRLRTRGFILQSAVVCERGANCSWQTSENR